MTKIHRIVCPTDFSPAALHAAEYAAELARSFGAELILLHIIPELTYPLRSFGMVTSFPTLREELHKRASQELHNLAGKVCTGIAARTELRDGSSHDQILESVKANGADLIVMGTHGHTGLKHLMLGSTAERIVRMAECPVLTVRSPS